MHNLRLDNLWRQSSSLLFFEFYLQPTIDHFNINTCTDTCLFLKIAYEIDIHHA